MSQARISSVTGCDVRARKSGIGILPSRLFVDRGARSLSEDLWRREKFESAFFSRNLREEKEVDNDEDVDDMADEEDERRLGGLPVVEGIGLSESLAGASGWASGPCLGCGVFYHWGFRVWRLVPI